MSPLSRDPEQRAKQLKNLSRTGRPPNKPKPDPPELKSAEVNAGELLAGLRPGEPTRHQKMLVKTLSRSMVNTDRERHWLDRNPNIATEKAWAKMEQIQKLDRIQLELHRELEAADEARVAAVEAEADKENRLQGRVKIGYLSPEAESPAVRREKAAAVFKQMIEEGSQELHGDRFERLRILAVQGALGDEARALAQEHSPPHQPEPADHPEGSFTIDREGQYRRILGKATEADRVRWAWEKEQMAKGRPHD